MVWQHLVGTIGLTALIRNLARMTRIGTIDPYSPVSDRVVDG
jgi:60 kDa SS-A/Ro ribonucleoprotein